jgi:hypothetical protein
MTSTPLRQHILELKAWHESGRSGGAPAGEAEQRTRRRDRDGHKELESEQVASSACYVPTPAQIRAACLRIQQEWSEAERRRRAGRRDTRAPRVLRVLRVDTVW